MKKYTLLIILSVFISPLSYTQEFADFSIDSPNQGTGTFINGCIPNFTWEAIGAINGSVQILNDEEFVDGNEFENRFGQANNAENLRIQIYPNGAGTDGTPILSKARLTLNFDKSTPPEAWGFCVVDIDVENCLISAIDEFGNSVGKSVINEWLVELFDADPVSDGLDVPKWDSTHAALLGSDTPAEYLIYDSLVIGGLPSSEAAAAFFMPDIPLKSLIIDFENLQQNYYTSFHFYIVSDDDKTFVPDDNFEQALIDLGYDEGSLNDLVPTINISGITNLSVSSKNIADLTGIEDFAVLVDFRCHINEITELDVSKNSHLKILNADNNNLNTIDVSQNPNLESFSVSDNNLTEIDVSNNPVLRSLYFYNNNITALDVSNNPGLKILYCNNNNLTSIELSQNPLLEHISVDHNQINALNTSVHTNLTELKCFNNKINSLDVSNNKKVTVLTCQNNQLTNLDLSSNASLGHLNCSGNQLQTLDLTQNNALIYANCSHNHLQAINLPGSTVLKYLDCSSNQLPAIDLQKPTKLEYIDCSNNQVAAIDLSFLENLFVLDCDSNQLISLDLSSNDTLYWVDCSNNQLTELNLRNGGNAQLTGETTPLYPMYFDPDPAFIATNNPNLICIQVDDANASAGYPDWVKDETTFYTEDCGILSGVQVNGEEIKGFNPDLLTYEIELPGGTTELPEVTATAANSTITLNILQADNLPGSASVEVLNGDGSTKQVYTLNFSFPTSANIYSPKNDFLLFPNPATNKVTVQIPINQASNSYYMEIIDLDGKKVIGQIIPQGLNISNIDVNSLNDGVYICKIQLNEKCFTQKLTIQKK